MAEDKSVTTIAEVEGIKFLRDRLLAISNRIHLHPNDSVLWIGAGISAKFGSLPTWNQFIREAADRARHRIGEADYKIIGDLLVAGRSTFAAELLSDRLGEEFHLALIESFSKSASRLPAEFGYWNVRDVITTNYDLMLERTLPWYTAVAPSDAIEQLISANFKIVKLHGSINNPRSCVASISTYATTYNSGVHWYLSNIFSNFSVIFLGSSMSVSEPYFRLLQLLKANGRVTQRHYAVMAVPNEDVAKKEGKRLAQYGIELLPYIPDSTHGFIDELVAYIEKNRGSQEGVLRRIQTVNDHVRNGQNKHAVALLWHVCHAPLEHLGVRRELGDRISSAFDEMLSGDPLRDKELVDWSVLNEFDLALLWSRAAELCIQSSKSINGLRKALVKIQGATGRDLPHLRLKLNEMDAKFKKSAAARSPLSP